MPGSNGDLGVAAVLRHRTATLIDQKGVAVRFASIVIWHPPADDSAHTVEGAGQVFTGSQCRVPGVGRCLCHLRYRVFTSGCAICVSPPASDPTLTIQGAGIIIAQNHLSEGAGFRGLQKNCRIIGLSIARAPPVGAPQHLIVSIADDGPRRIDGASVVQKASGDPGIPGAGHPVGDGR